jgi:hypothetical protein
MNKLSEKTCASKQNKIKVQIKSLIVRKTQNDCIIYHNFALDWFAVKYVKKIMVDTPSKKNTNQNW